MKIHYPALGALLLVALAPAADAQDEKSAGQTYATPQAVWDAAQAAQKKQEFTKFVNCFAPQAQKEMAIGLAFSALSQQAAARGDEKLRTQFKAILDALNKHGLTDEVGKKVNLRPGDAKEAEKVHAELAGLIKNPAGVAADLMNAYSKTEPFNRKPPEGPTPQLTDVKIDGDKAKGTTVVKVGEREVRLPAEFVKVGGGWKLSPQPQQAPPPRPAGGPGR
jgi:hypothetical protein